MGAIRLVACTGGFLRGRYCRKGIDPSPYAVAHARAAGLAVAEETLSEVMDRGRTFQTAHRFTTVPLTWLPRSRDFAIFILDYLHAVSECLTRGRLWKWCLSRCCGSATGWVTAVM